MGKEIVEIKVKKDDIKNAIYFISNLAQASNKGMHGALSSKGDFMGGIFDRWINIVPEAVLFNQILLPKISKDNLKVITDYYDYEPKDAGIAPDVIGVKYNNKTIPFAIFDDKWKAVPGCPQIEVKSNKITQKMVNLRDQNYSGKYLVISETNFRVDYLIPLLANDFFKNEILDNLQMDDNTFIQSNKDNLIHQANKIDLSDDSIGTIRLLKVTTAEEFMKNAIECDSKFKAEYITDIIPVDKINGDLNKKLNFYGEKKENGLFRFNDLWYNYKNDKKVVYRESNVKTLDIYVEKPDKIKVLKINKLNMYIKTEENNIFGDINLKKDKIYKIDFAQLERGAGKEFFMLKSSLKYLTDYEKKLLDDIKNAIEK